MTNYNDEELTIILAMYYFEKNRLSAQLINILTQKFNKFFDKDENPQNINYEISIFKNIDPSFNNNKIDVNEKYYTLWNYFIEDDRIEELRRIYKKFKSEEKLYENNSDYNYNEETDDNITINIINDKFEEYANFPFEDKPKERYDNLDTINIKNKRSTQTMINALAKANYCCEFSNEHKSFLRKKSNAFYTEGHHLIPLKYQYKYEYNLDVEANIVSLCSECHNIIHYGRDYKKILEKLYNERKERLKKCNLEITLEELLKMYE